jgi:hypothetical protein
MQEEKGQNKQTPKDELREKLTEPLPGMVPNILGVQMLKSAFQFKREVYMLDAGSRYSFGTQMTTFDMEFFDSKTTDRIPIKFTLEPSQAEELRIFLEEYRAPIEIQLFISLGIKADPVPQEAKEYIEGED